MKSTFSVCLVSLVTLSCGQPAKKTLFRPDSPGHERVREGAGRPKQGPVPWVSKPGQAVPQLKTEALVEKPTTLEPRGKLFLSDKALSDLEGPAAEASRVAFLRGVLTPDSSYVVVPDALIGREFVMHGSRQSNSAAVQPNSTGGLRVRFGIDGGELVLLQSSQGQLASNDYEAQHLVARFPSARLPSGQGWAIDFAAGLEYIPVFETYWIARNEDVAFSAARPHLQVLNAKVLGFEAGPDAFLLRQLVTTARRPSAESASTVVSSDESLNLVSSEFRFVFRPIDTSLDYHPFPSPSVGGALTASRFFETEPLFDYSSPAEPRGLLRHAFRFNPKRPVVFAVSDNTPETYRQAVKDGVLYWGNVLGENAIQVVDAESGARAPSIRYNMLQWIHTDGRAYADWMPDPLTGEILQAQVYMTNAWALRSVAEARHYVSEYLSREAASPSRGDENGPAAHRHSGLGCNLVSEAHFARGLARILESTEALGEAEADALILKFSQDVVRTVMAHEIGHVLGLRHNFLASTFGTIQEHGSEERPFTWFDRPKVIEEYLRARGTFRGHKTYAKVLPSSSVMDYIDQAEMAVIGDFITWGSKALPYDELNVNYLYDRLGSRDLEELAQAGFDLEREPSCNDGDVSDLGAPGGAPDCLKLDSGVSTYAEYFYKRDVLLPERLARVLDLKALKAVVLSEGGEPSTSGWLAARWADELDGDSSLSKIRRHMLRSLSSSAFFVNPERDPVSELKALERNSRRLGPDSPIGDVSLFEALFGFPERKIVREAVRTFIAQVNLDPELPADAKRVILEEAQSRIERFDLELAWELMNLSEIAGKELSVTHRVAFLRVAGQVAPAFFHQRFVTSSDPENWESVGWFKRSPSGTYLVCDEGEPDCREIKIPTLSVDPFVLSALRDLFAQEGSGFVSLGGDRNSVLDDEAAEVRAPLRAHIANFRAALESRIREANGLQEGRLPSAVIAWLDEFTLPAKE